MPRVRGCDSSAGDGRPRPGWYAYQVLGAVQLPSWAVEVALTIERPTPPTHTAPSTQAMVLLRAPPRVRWLAAIAEVAAEVEAAAGARPPDGDDGLAEGRAGIGSRLRMGSALPGLVPVTSGVVLAHIGVGGARGLPAPLRRWQPVAGVELSWRPGAGSVLTCDGPGGVSAQAVVALRGLGNIDAISPPAGGALVLRAWRAWRNWGVACGLVLGAAETLGLGREAQRVAARARAANWDAVVLSGSAALHLARAGGPAQPAPATGAHGASDAQVADLVAACLQAGGLGRPDGSSWVLTVTP